MSESVPERVSFNYQAYNETTKPCPSCRGLGKKLLAALGLRNVFEEQICSRCGGNGRVSRE